jgi:hypothetical protein
MSEYDMARLCLSIVDGWTWAMHWRLDPHWWIDMFEGTDDLGAAGDVPS